MLHHICSYFYHSNEDTVLFFLVYILAYTPFLDQTSGCLLLSIVVSLVHSKALVQRRFLESVKFRKEREKEGGREEDGRKEGRPNFVLNAGIGITQWSANQDSYQPVLWRATPSFFYHPSVVSLELPSGAGERSEDTVIIIIAVTCQMYAMCQAPH